MTESKRRPVAPTEFDSPTMQEFKKLLRRYNTARLTREGAIAGDTKRDVRAADKALDADRAALLDFVEKLEVRATAGHGYPHVANVAVGDLVEARVWQDGVVTWAGDHVIYVQTPDGVKHRVDRYANTLRTKT